MFKAFCIVFVLLICSSNICAENVKKTFTGNYSCGLGADATCSIGTGDLVGTFLVNSDVGEKILNACKYDDMCSVSGVVDEYNNIIKVISVSKNGEDAPEGNRVDNNRAGISLFEGFRGYKWKQDINLKDKNISKMFESNDGKISIFLKHDENLTLGDVKLITVLYTVQNKEFVSVDLSWRDNSDFDVGRQVAQMVADQIGGFEPITDDQGFHFEQGGLLFQFSLKQNGQSLLGSLVIKVNQNSTPKGTF